MLISKSAQEKINKEILEKSSNNIARLKEIYEDFFCLDENGNKIPKPSLTVQQVLLFRDKLKEIANTYNSVNIELEQLADEREKVNKKALETKNKLVSFCSERGYKIPKVYKQLYGIKD